MWISVWSEQWSSYGYNYKINKNVKSTSYALNLMFVWLMNFFFSGSFVIFILIYHRMLFELELLIINIKIVSLGVLFFFFVNLIYSSIFDIQDILTFTTLLAGAISMSIFTSSLKRFNKCVYKISAHLEFFRR